MPDPILSSILAGCVFGLSAGAAPGPLLTLVLTETLTQGLRGGVRVALSPLLTDPPIILLSTLLLAELARFSWALGLLSAAGGLVVLHMARQTWNAPPALTPGMEGRCLSLRKGVITNLLNPHPYLFWIGVGAPLLVRGYQEHGPAAPMLFLGAFYACIVLAKVSLALLAARSRMFLRGRAYGLLLKALALLLAAFGLLLLRDAWDLLRPPA